MSNIQRYASLWRNEPPVPAANGDWITYNDHVAALRDCEERAREEMSGPLDRLITFAEGAQSTAYAAGHAAGVQSARDAVIEVSQHDFPDIDPLEFDTPFDYAKAICEAALKGDDNE